MGVTLLLRDRSTLDHDMKAAPLVRVKVKITVKNAVYGRSLRRHHPAFKTVILTLTLESGFALNGTKMTGEEPGRWSLGGSPTRRRGGCSGSCTRQRGRPSSAPPPSAPLSGRRTSCQWIRQARIAAMQWTRRSGSHESHVGVVNNSSNFS